MILREKTTSRLIKACTLGAVQNNETGFRPILMIQDYNTGIYLKYDDKLRRYITI